MLSAGSHRSSLSEFQAAGPATVNGRRRREALGLDLFCLVKGTYYTLPSAPSTVGVERSGTADLPCMRSADHITDALVSLHWLRVPQRIEYKIAVLTYKALWECAAIPGSSGSGRRSTRPSGTAFYRHESSVGAFCQTLQSPPSVAGLSRLPVHESGTFCHRKRRQPSRCLCFVSV